ncbi:alpha/beta fold hydrolase [Kitasatospora sp. NPDC056184]|uniref:alpha/beta fold hydrolase n=1 Tax=Kitasatospora sp. NPDC056184 TaxID=3345738 RepID=UPI0035E18B50
MHGLGGWTHNWAALIDRLRPSVHCPALDLPGFGRSAPPPDGRVTVEHQAAAVAGHLPRQGAIFAPAGTARVRGARPRPHGPSAAPRTVRGGSGARRGVILGDHGPHREAAGGKRRPVGRVGGVLE